MNLADSVMLGGHIFVDTMTKELVKATLYVRRMPDFPHYLYFEKNKLIKVEIGNNNATDSSPRRKYYIENGKVLNPPANIRKDSMENFYSLLSQVSLDMANTKEVSVMDFGPDTIPHVGK